MTGAGIIQSINKSADTITSHKKEINRFLNKWIKAILRAAVLICMGFVMLYPVLYMLSGAFKCMQDVSDPTVIWVPKKFDAYAMSLAVESLDYVNTLIETLKVLIPSVILQLGSTLLAAYGFARFKFRERNLLFGILIFTIIVPVQTIIIPLYANFNYLHLNGSELPFYIMAAFGMGIRSGLYIYIMRQFFRNMPKELEEAAMIDGCGPLQTFIKIMLPNVKPAIVVVLVFSIVWYWNDYFQAVMFLSSNTLSVSLTTLDQMLNVTAQHITQLSTIDIWLLRDPVLDCGCLLVSGPLLVMYVFFQRFFTESIERTGIVG